MMLLRSLLFMVAVTAITMVAGILVTIGILLPMSLRYAIIALWRKGFMGLAAGVLGIRMKVLGRENIPAEPSVILSKHQSAWETVALQEVFPPLVFVLKKELLRMPFFGWGLAAMKMISIDRKAGKDALGQVVEQGKERLAAGYWVVIFPEGTRVAPGEKRRYKPGGAHLAVKAGAKVVPVAHNAGEVWPRQVFPKRPGTVTVSIGPAIDSTGLTEVALNAQVEAWIEGEMRRISPHRYKDAPVPA
ncbi:MAG: 1-acyl-sn-glycerol-3-phosphate acyltransferase [Betaproteobacteria bacterium]|nr:1-acyl-sn-glycerol-3-phosphate acyltransferase [Betaproteobacteria bacterium]